MGVASPESRSTRRSPAAQLASAQLIDASASPGRQGRRRAPTEPPLASALGPLTPRRQVSGLQAASGQERTGGTVGPNGQTGPSQRNAEGCVAVPVLPPSLTGCLEISTLKEEIIEALQKHLLMNFSLANMDATNYLDNNTTRIFYEDQIISNYIILTICCIGVPLNGIVIWLLGFQIKRSPFTTLILNLAIADFGFLLSMAIHCTNVYINILLPGIPWDIVFSLTNITYINGLLLLTAISIDRCVAVLFPIWHRRSRPKYLSPAVCAFLWIFSSFLFGIGQYTIHNMQYLFWNLHLVVTAVLCLPLITTSAVILFIKLCLKSKETKRGRLLVMILITLLCFLILNLPLYIYVSITHFLKKNFFDVYELNFYLCPSASLNSSINPVIYFLVGRKKRAQSRESIKVIFQRVFREDKAPETR
ncbi:mas-related G-protein coupled receptor member H-like [Vipera latastei]